MEEEEPTLVEDAHWDNLRDSTNPVAPTSNTKLPLAKSSTGANQNYIKQRDKDPFTDFYRKDGAWTDPKNPMHNVKS